ERPLEEQGIKPLVGTWRVVSANMQPEQILPGPPMIMIGMPQVIAAAFKSDQTIVESTTNKYGQYTLTVRVIGEGKYTRNITPDRFKPEERARGIVTMQPNDWQGSDRIEASLMVSDKAMPHVHVNKGDTTLYMMPPGNGAAVSMFIRQS